MTVRPANPKVKGGESVMQVQKTERKREKYHAPKMVEFGAVLTLTQGDY